MEKNIHENFNGISLSYESIEKSIEGITQFIYKNYFEKKIKFAFI
jgi:hypothetical protein